MKKFSIIIISSFVSALLFGAVALADPPSGAAGAASAGAAAGGGANGAGAGAAANEPPDIKVYYSESIGQGEKVYHITACQKTRWYEPLVCYEGLPSEYTGQSGQCRLSNGQIDEGKKVKGCLTSSAGDGGYPEVNTGNYPGGCREPERQGYKYVPTYGVTDEASIQGNISQARLEGQIAWPNNNPSSIPQNLINGIRQDGTAVPIYRAAPCLSWDVYAATGQSSPVENRDFRNLISAGAGLFVGPINGPQQSIIGQNGEDCNNSYNTSPFTDGYSFTCTVSYLIKGKTGSDILGQYISMLYKWAAGIVGIISVLVIVFSGIQISMAGGDTAKIDSAKNRIMQSIIGLALLFLSGLILYTINPGFFTG